MQIAVIPQATIYNVITYAFRLMNNSIQLSSLSGLNYRLICTIIIAMLFLSPYERSYNCLCSNCIVQVSISPTSVVCVRSVSVHCTMRGRRLSESLKFNVYYLFMI